jgi:hypothetical protein
MIDIIIDRTEKKKSLMPTTGIEPVTFALRERRSTTELNRHIDQKRKKSGHNLYFKMNLFPFLRLNKFIDQAQFTKREKQENYSLNDLLFVDVYILNYSNRMSKISSISIVQL